MKTLKETLKEFSNIIKDENLEICRYITEGDIRLANYTPVMSFNGEEISLKDFISQSIKTALEGVVMERYSIKYADIKDEGFYNDGWMDCREQLLKNIEAYLK